MSDLSGDETLFPSPQDLNAFPGAPAAHVAAEIREFLREDTSRLGDVYRGELEGLSAEQIAEQLGVSTSNFVWNYAQMLASLLKGQIPNSPSVALQAARKCRSLLKSSSWSPAARAHLETLRNLLEARAEDDDAKRSEEQQLLETTLEAESRAEPGVYVYTLPHYLRYPYDPDTGRTLLKVGESRNDAVQRFNAQTRTTSLPEEPVLLRVYKSMDVDAVAAEKKFHTLLQAADHGRTATRVAGREWFLTTTRLLDAIAEVVGLEVRVVNSVETVDDV